jgi:hypothetical protein
MKKLLPILCMGALSAHAQYAPQAGISGSTAVSPSQISSWATGCSVQRGLMHMAQPALGYVTAGDSSMVPGPADGSIVSLGDSGVAVVTFAQPISNGPGADFAVFENGFSNPANAEEAYLELAFVEVSSDGQQFFRFPASSQTQTSQQIAGAGDYADARSIHNLAGKYKGGFGTPFDLQELAGRPGLDINHITHIRIIDVIGDIQQYTSLDDSGRVINDPYPTPFPVGGFDLDAVGVIRQTSIGYHQHSTVRPVLYPNPVSGSLNLNGAEDATRLELHDAAGRLLLEAPLQAGHARLELSHLAPGLYFISLYRQNERIWSGGVVRQ